LVVDRDPVLSCSIALESFPMISGRDAESIQFHGDFQSPKFAAGRGGNVDEPFDPIALRQGFRVQAPERFDHGMVETLLVTTVKDADHASCTTKGNSKMREQGIVG
jgi:hypothetical protein